MWGFFLEEGIAHGVGGGLFIVGIDIWDEVTLEGNFAVELILGVGEAGCFFETIPFL